jgi:hypothetical protein
MLHDAMVQCAFTAPSKHTSVIDLFTLQCYDAKHTVYIPFTDHLVYFV